MIVNISGHQIRMARALLNVSREEIEAATGITAMTIQRIEKGAVRPRDETLETLLTYFEGIGIAFHNNDGVSRAQTNIRRFSGPRAITDLLEDVYETVKDGGDICVSSCDEELVEKYYEPRGERHSVRMAKIADKVDCRVLLKEGNYNYPYTSYVRYRWMPKQHFKPNTFYVYNNKLGLIEYKGPICEITIIETPQLALAFRDLFEMVWQQCNDVPAPPAKKSGQ